MTAKPPSGSDVLFTTTAVPFDVWFSNVTVAVSFSVSLSWTVVPASVAANAMLAPKRKTSAARTATPTVIARDIALLVPP